MVCFAVFELEGEYRVGRRVEGDMLRVLKVEGDVAKDGVMLVIGKEIIDDDSCPSAIPVASVRLLAPVPRPRRNVFCVGKNYREHALEFAGSGFDSSSAEATPQVPILFSKVPEAVVGPGDAIEIDPSVSTAIDYEVELAVIIGKEGRNIPTEKAMDYVWGYTAVNDVTARDLQFKHNQWLIGKSQDTFCPMGPMAVTKEDIDLTDTTVRSFVNGELRQNSNTKLLIFDVPTIIANLSNGITLRVGDIIATGTPAGVGVGFQPPKYLKDGDRVSVEVQGIGSLENPVVKLN